MMMAIGNSRSIYELPDYGNMSLFVLADFAAESVRWKHRVRQHRCLSSAANAASSAASTCRLALGRHEGLWVATEQAGFKFYEVVGYPIRSFLPISFHPVLFPTLHFYLHPFLSPFLTYPNLSVLIPHSLTPTEILESAESFLAGAGAVRRSTARQTNSGALYRFKFRSQDVPDIDSATLLKRNWVFRVYKSESQYNCRLKSKGQFIIYIFIHRIGSIQREKRRETHRQILN